MKRGTQKATWSCIPLNWRWQDFNTLCIVASYGGLWTSSFTNPSWTVFSSVACCSHSELQREWFCWRTAGGCSPSGNQLISSSVRGFSPKHCSTQPSGGIISLDRLTYCKTFDFGPDTQLQIRLVSLSDRELAKHHPTFTSHLWNTCCVRSVGTGQTTLVRLHLEQYVFCQQGPIAFHLIESTVNVHFRSIMSIYITISTQGVENWQCRIH